MDKQQSINNQLEILDFIFINIKIAKRISIANFFVSHQEEFLKMDIDLLLLESIILKMVANDKLLKNSDNTYVINPFDAEFISFQNDYLTSEIKKRKEKRKESAIKIIPIFLTIIFSATTILVSISNLNLTRQKSQVKNKSIYVKFDTSKLKFNQSKLEEKDTIVIIR